MEQEMLIVFVIVVQVTNMIGAYVFGILTDRMGGKRALNFSLWLMIGLVVCLFFAQSQEVYFIIGAGAGFAMAGLQSISRTMVGMFSPPGQSAEFYGFFSVAGRTSSFIGPAVYGIVAGLAARYYESGGRTEDLAEQSGQRIAILVIVLFLLVGLFLLRFVDEDRARAAAVSSEEAASA
jgi:UMF1 family MFS transporter